MKPNNNFNIRKGINDDNLMIADFIGFKPCLVADSNGNKIYVGAETPFGWKYPDCYPEADYLISVQDLKFNTSWDWLMPVVEQINLLDDYRYTVYIASMDTRIEDNITGDVVVDINCKHSIYELRESVYEAVVQFIKNQNN